MDPLHLDAADRRSGARQAIGEDAVADFRCRSRGRRALDLRQRDAAAQARDSVLCAAQAQRCARPSARVRPDPDRAVDAVNAGRELDDDGRGCLRSAAERRGARQRFRHGPDHGVSRRSLSGRVDEDDDGLRLRPRSACSRNDQPTRREGENGGGEAFSGHGRRAAAVRRRARRGSRNRPRCRAARTARSGGAAGRPDAAAGLERAAQARENGAIAGAVGDRQRLLGHRGAAAEGPGE